MAETIHKVPRILVVDAHADDGVVLGGVPIIRSIKEEGAEVVWVVATNGQHGNHKFVETADLVRRRKEEQEEASRIIGAKENIFLDFPDLGLKFQTERFEQELLKLVLTVRPTRIITFDPAKQNNGPDDETHPDHRVVANSTTEVSRIHATVATKSFPLDRLSNRPMIMMYYPQTATHVVDGTAYFDQLSEAVAAFKSQNLPPLALKDGRFRQKIRIY